MNLVSPPEAIRLLREALPAGRSERVRAVDAVGRILARDVVLRQPSPRHAVSAMDGYAVRSSDTPGRLSVAGLVSPGSRRRNAPPSGVCVQILTGGPVPPGCDAVAALEDCEVQGKLVAVPASAPGRHIVPAGAATPAGTRFSAGTRITPGIASALADGGAWKVAVRARFEVRIVPVGTELVEGTVRESVSPILKSQLERAGCRPTLRPPVPDEPKAIRAALRGTAPVVITTGGTGPSERDLVASLGRGRMLFSGIEVKPGRPAKAIRLPGGRLWIALPGNPTSALLIHQAVVLPALRGEGDGAAATGSHACLVEEALEGHPTRWRIVPVRSGPRGLRPAGDGPSAAAGWLAPSSGVVLVPPGGRVAVGETAEVLPW